LKRIFDTVVGLPLQDTGVGLYRILSPIIKAKQKGIIRDNPCYPFTGDNQTQFATYPDEFWMHLCRYADVVQSTIVANRDMLLKLMNLRKKWGFKLIFDIDDNLYSVSSDNPAAKEVDRLKDNFEACLQVADGVTVSVPNLKSVYSKLNDNIFVSPNFVDKKMFDFPRKRHKGIRIGWRGAYGHREDLEMIRPVIEAIKRDYKVTFVTFGWNPEWSDEHHDWVGSFEFPKKLASLNLDIGLIPLIDSAYNRCKSNLAFLEYSALGIPTVTSPVENQKGCGINCKTSYEWYEAIVKLIKEKPTVEFVETEKVTELYKWIESLKRKDM
jgi:O-antigen biosynthesis protein